MITNAKEYYRKLDAFLSEIYDSVDLFIFKKV